MPFFREVRADQVGEGNLVLDDQDLRQLPNAGRPCGG
jgi:hypothetical protein